MGEVLDEPDSTASTLGAQLFERYAAAIEELDENDRLAILGRIEFRYSYEQMALLLDSPSLDAARMAVRRAIVRLGSVMASGG